MARLDDTRGGLLFRAAKCRDKGCKVDVYVTLLEL